MNKAFSNSEPNESPYETKNERDRCPLQQSKKIIKNCPCNGCQQFRQEKKKQAKQNLSKSSDELPLVKSRFLSTRNKAFLALILSGTIGATIYGFRRTLQSSSSASEITERKTNGVSLLAQEGFRFPADIAISQQLNAVLDHRWKVDNWQVAELNNEGVQELQIFHPSFFSEGVNQQTFFEERPKLSALDANDIRISSLIAKIPKNIICGPQDIRRFSEVVELVEIQIRGQHYFLYLKDSAMDRETDRNQPYSVFHSDETGRLTRQLVLKPTAERLPDLPGIANISYILSDGSNGYMRVFRSSATLIGGGIDSGVIQEVARHLWME